MLSVGKMVTRLRGLNPNYVTDECDRSDWSKSTQRCKLCDMSYIGRVLRSTFHVKDTSYCMPEAPVDSVKRISRAILAGTCMRIQYELTTAVGRAMRVAPQLTNSMYQVVVAYRSMKMYQVYRSERRCLGWSHKSHTCRGCLVTGTNSAFATGKLRRLGQKTWRHVLGTYEYDVQVPGTSIPGTRRRSGLHTRMGLNVKTDLYLFEQNKIPSLL